jgi:two-component system, NarL family, response regulator NreC
MPRHLHLAHTADGSGPPRNGPTRVALAVNHPVMRRGLRELLEGEEGIEVVAVARDWVSVEQESSECHADVLVLDLRIAGGSSLDAIRHLRSLSPGTAIVAMTMEDSSVFARRAFEAGAAGFVLKDRADADLPEAIRRVARGESYESPRPALGSAGY